MSAKAERLAQHARDWQWQPDDYGDLYRLWPDTSDPISGRVRNALFMAGLITRASIATTPDRALLDRRNVGKVLVAAIRATVPYVPTLAVTLRREVID